MAGVFGLNTTRFNSNGGSLIASQQLLRGETVSRPGDPVKEDHVFDGWFEDDESFLQEWDFSIVPDRELTLHAKWLMVRIALDPNDDIYFSPLVVGYDLSELTPQEIYITNTGEVPTGDLTLSLSGNNADSFSLSVLELNSITPGGSELFTVTPITGLLSGYYSATVNITGNGITTSINVYFIVELGELSGMQIFAYPVKLSYIHGDTLDLTGLVVKLIYGNGSEIVYAPYTTFESRAITVNLQNGSALSFTNHNDVAIRVSRDMFEVDAGVLNVNRKALTVTNAVHTKEYDNSTDADGVLVTLTGVVGNEDVSVASVTAEYTSAAIGTKTINISAIVLAGADANNYMVTLPLIVTVTGGITEIPGTATITLTMAVITDGTPNINETINLSRTVSGNTSRQITLVNPEIYDPGSIRWEVAGAGIIYAGNPVTGTEASFTLDATNTRYNVIGGNTLILQVKIDGTLYQKNIFFTITE